MQIQKITWKYRHLREAKETDRETLRIIDLILDGLLEKHSKSHQTHSLLISNQLISRIPKKLRQYDISLHLILIMMTMSIECI